MCKKMWWGLIADLISSFFLRKRNNLVSLRPNYLFFIGYSKGGGSEVQAKHLWICHCATILNVQYKIGAILFTLHILYIGPVIVAAI